MSAANKARGAKFEIDVLKYFRSRGLDVERLRLAGRADEGDIVWKDGGLPFIFELKNEKAMNLTNYVRQAEVEARNYAEQRNIPMPHFAAIVKKRMAPVAEAFVVIPLAEYINQTEVPF